MSTRTAFAGALLAAGLARAPDASARSVRDEPYPFETTWNAAVRLIRVDLALPITERDVDIGYLTFSYRDGNRVVPGSVEIVRTDVEGRAGSRVIVQIPLMPTYVEGMILTRLGRKLRVEFGEAPAAPPRRPPSPPPSAPSETPTPPPERAPEAPAPERARE